MNIAPLSHYNSHSPKFSDEQLIVNALGSPPGKVEEAAKLRLSSFGEGDATQVLLERIFSRIRDEFGEKTPPPREPSQGPNPEEAARKVIEGIAALLPRYAASNPELSGEEVLDRFFAAVRDGVEQGYGDAVKILKATGADTIEGVNDTVAATKLAIDEAVNRFEQERRDALQVG